MYEVTIQSQVEIVTSENIMYEVTIQSQVEIVTSENNHVRSYNIVTGRDCDK